LGAWNYESTCTVPVEYSAGPVLEGCEPLFLMSISNSLKLIWLMTWPSLFPKPLELVRQFRATFAAVGEFADEQRKRLRRAIWSPPASTGSNRVMDQLGSDIFGILVVATVHQARPSFFAFGFESSEQHFTGMVLKVRTTWARGTFFASSSALDLVVPMMSFVLPVSIGRQQVTITLPDKSPARFKTSSIRDQCPARRSASASFAASPGVPVRALPWASRASLLSLSLLRA